MFLTIFTWWVWLEILGLVALPFAFLLFKNLPDRGYPLSKTLGVLFLSYLLWLGSSLHIIANRRWSIILILLAMSVLAVVILRQQWDRVRAFFVHNWRLVVLTELIFSAGIVGWAIVRAYNPGIQLPEHAMNYAFINTILRSPYMPPPDPWLAGYPLNYYYFGQFILATLTSLSGIPVNISYNLAIGLIFALAAMGIFSLTYNLTRGDAAKPANFNKAVFAGVVAVVFLLLIGNLEGLLEFMYAHNVGSAEFWKWVGIRGLTNPYSSAHWYPTETDWWVRSARVMDTLTPEGASLDMTLNDNVFLNLLVGYPHAHLMAVPLALLTLSFSLALLVGEKPSGWVWLKQKWFFFVAALVSAGAMGPTNSWDLATWGILFVAVIFIAGYMRREVGEKSWWIDTGIVAAVAFIGMFMLFMPYYNYYQPYGSLGPWLGPAARPLHLFLLLGFLASISIVVLLVRTIPEISKSSWKTALLAVVPLAIPFLVWLLMGRNEGAAGITPSAGGKLLSALPLILPAFLALIFLLAGIQKNGPEQNKSAVFHLLCVFTAFYIVYGVELFFFRDALLAGRGNTVFKFYYHVWVLLAVAGGYGFYHLLFVWKPAWALLKVVRGSWWLIFVFLLLGSLFYPVAGLLTKTNFFQGTATLDGLSFLPAADREVIDWFNKNVQGTPVVVEASNVWSLEESRISSRTGLPTVMGWVLHEKGWRGYDDREFMARVKDLELIYQDEDLGTVESLLVKYRAEYIVVGWLENQRYGAGIKERFDGWFEPAFSNGAITVYKASPTVWRPAKNPRAQIQEIFYRDPPTADFLPLPASGELPRDTYHFAIKMRNTGQEKVTLFLDVAQSDGIRLGPWGAPEWDLGPGGEVGLFMQGSNLRPAGRTVQITFTLKEKGSNRVLDTKSFSFRSK